MLWEWSQEEPVPPEMAQLLCSSSWCCSLSSPVRSHLLPSAWFHEHRSLLGYSFWQDLCLPTTTNETNGQGRSEQSESCLLKEVEKALWQRELLLKTTWLWFVCISKGGSSPWLVEVYANEVFYQNNQETEIRVACFTSKFAECSIRSFGQTHLHLKIALYIFRLSPSPSGLLESYIVYGFSFPFQGSLESLSKEPLLHISTNHKAWPHHPLPQTVSDYGANSAPRIL